MTAVDGVPVPGLFYSYSQSSFVALFAAAGSVASRGRRPSLQDRLHRMRGRSDARRRRLRGNRDRRSFGTRRHERPLAPRPITLDAFKHQPVAGVGIGGQPRASAEASGGAPPSATRPTRPRSPCSRSSGVIGFAVYLWLLVAVGWALVSRRARTQTFAIGLAAVGAFSSSIRCSTRASSRTR